MTGRALGRMLVVGLAAAALVLIGSVGVHAASVQRSPTANNGSFSTPTGPYADGGSSASGTNNQVHRYYGYDFSSIPAGATIDGIEVRVDAWVDAAWSVWIFSAGGYLDVELSWDNGSTWTSSNKSTGNLTESENDIYLGGSNDLWGHAWTREEIANNFRVRLVATEWNSFGSNTVNVDWLPVTVYYTTTAALSVSIDDIYLSDLTVTQSDLDDWFGDSASMLASMGSFDVTVTAGSAYQVDVCYEFAAPIPDPGFTGAGPLLIENEEGTDNWDYLPFCSTGTIELEGFAGTSTSGETNTYPLKVDLDNLGDRSAGDTFDLRIKVVISAP